MTASNKDFNKNAFSMNLKRLMKKNNIKNIDLALKLNLSKSAISNYLAGTSVPRTDTISKISEIFGVQIESLFKEKFEPGKIPQSMIKIRKPEVSVFFSESDPSDISYYQAPMFINKLFSSDIIYVDENYCDRILSTFPFHGDFECYAVRIRDNLLSASGLPQGSVAIFAATKEVNENELAAILYKDELKILVRRVKAEKNKITLLTDETEETYKYNIRNDKVVVLGKVVNSMVAPN